jgi:hypothetical protein
MGTLTFLSYKIEMAMKNNITLVDNFKMKLVNFKLINQRIATQMLKDQEEIKKIKEVFCKKILCAYVKM